LEGGGPEAVKRALSIAGSDSGGGAGIQADLKTFCAFGVYGMTAITAVTAQNTQRVEAIQALSPQMVAAQIRCVVEDIGVDAVKTGMLFSSDIIEVVAAELARFQIKNLVVDPVMVAKSGARLLREDAIQSLMTRLLPLALLVTPNLPEALILAGMEKIEGLEEMQEAARRIREKGVRAVLIKGGHLPGEETLDLFFDGEQFHLFRGKRISTRNTHGTGCTYSAAICALLALGYNLPEAVGEARRYMELVITHSLPLGGGFGPTNHLAPLFIKAEINPQEGGKLW
jgi:hydroxymethylpyrimidine/phosphomethylpyrimidine kinase